MDERTRWHNCYGENIQSVKNNVTRFVVISDKKTNKKTVSDKTSIAISFNEDSRVLYLKHWSQWQKNINMTKIESRPTKEKLGNYYFFIDIEGHFEDKDIKECLIEIEEVSTLKFLGSYPKFS